MGDWIDLGDRINDLRGVQTYDVNGHSRITKHLLKMNDNKDYMWLKVVCIASLGGYLFWLSDKEEPNAREEFEQIEIEYIEGQESIDSQRPRKREVRPFHPIDTHIGIALNIIKKYEGFRSEPYRCAAGVLTIGYGETDPEIVGQEYISEQDAYTLLKEKVIDISKEIKRTIRHDLNHNQLAALTSFYYNLGPGNFGNIARRINKGNIDEAADAILLYDKCDGVALKGLKMRRAEEQYLFTL